MNDQGWASRQLSRQGDNGLMPTTCCLFWRCTPILATRGWHRVVVPLKVKLNRQYANVSEKRQRLMSSLFFLTAVSSYIKLVMRVWHGCSFYLFLRVPNVSWAWESVHLAADNYRLNAKNLHLVYTWIWKSKYIINNCKQEKLFFLKFKTKLDLKSPWKLKLICILFF